MNSGLEILTTAEMAEADRRAVALGVPSLTLMENAGRAVADEAMKMVKPGSRIAVVCGPGNNGGDGFVAARYLRRASYDVRCHLLGSREALRGDAAEMARRLVDGPIRPMEPEALQSIHLVIDALFGAGLARPLDSVAAEMVGATNASGLPVLSVDVPSGLDGTTGAAAGPVVHATRTVTFFRKKPGHLLIPGRVLCGEVVVADIGMPVGVLARPVSEVAVGREQSASILTLENGPGVWQSSFPSPRLDQHKYTRGHAVVVSGPAHATGAARMAARGALRIGAGLVTVATPPDALPVNATHLTAILLKVFTDVASLADIFADERKNAVLIGPARGVAPATATEVAVVLRTKAAVVLDADALTVFADNFEPSVNRFGFMASAASAPPANAALLFELIASRAAPVVMTPHEGEFERLFPDLNGSKLDRARAAAKRSGATVVLKGADTVIADPHGRAAINANAPPWLATAGSGDVLAGFITGLLAQGMPAFDAACSAVWLHGECANVFGPGLIAEDLPEVLPTVLRKLQA